MISQPKGIRCQSLKLTNLQFSVYKSIQTRSIDAEFNNVTKSIHQIHTIMKQSFKVFTPQFQAEIDHLVARKLASEPDSQVDSEQLRAQFHTEVMNILMQYWSGDLYSLPVSYPRILTIPEYVEYEFDSSEIGQPLLPTMIPSSFTPQKVKLSKAVKLNNFIVDVVFTPNVERV